MAAASEENNASCTVPNQVDIDHIQHDIEAFISTHLDTCMKFADKSCIGRYLDAHRGVVAKASKGIISTAKWRKETVPSPLGCAVCKVDRTTHCFEFIGHDQFDRPVIYGAPARATKVSVLFLSNMSLD